VKDLAAQRLIDCRNKDILLSNLKRLFQHSIFHMLIDVQEMVERTQKAKDIILGTEASGFDEENYTALQGVRLEYA